MNTLKKFFYLKLFDKKLLVKAWIRLALIRVKISRYGFRHIHRSTKIGNEEANRGPAMDPRFPEKVAWAVRTASDFVPGAKTCLIRALAVHAMLARHGIPSSIRFGIHRDGGEELEAHAWVECNGVVLIGGENLDRYTPLTTQREKEL